MTISTGAVRAAPSTDARKPAFVRFLIAPRSRAVVLSLAGVVLLASALVHLQVILKSSGAAYDMISYQIQAESVFHHQNVYEVTKRYPYPPVWIWIIALLHWTSTTFTMRFDALSKLPATFGDLATAVVLFLYARRRFGWCWLAVIPMALFALNPVAIIIGAGHGQFDSLVMFFLLLALFLRGPREDQRVVWSALALGMAIALKGYPVLALPYFVVSAPRGSRVKLAIYSFVPLAVSCVVYSAIFGISTHMVTNIVGYRSYPDFGWAQLGEHSHFAALLTSLGPILSSGLPVCTLLFGAIAPPLLFRNRPVSAITLLFAGFYLLTYNMSVQYLVWILPFLCLAFPEGALAFTVMALFGIAGFYLHGYPTAIPKAAPWPDLLKPFVLTQSHAVMAIIGVSGCVAVYVLATTSSLAGRIQSWLPRWLRRGLAALEPLRVDLAPAAASSGVAAGDPPTASREAAPVGTAAL